MADNVSLPVVGTGGTGPIPVATEDIGGVQYQRVKLVDGTAASTASIPGSATDGLLVNLGANNDVTVTGTVGVAGGSVGLLAGAANIGNVGVNNAGGVSAVNIQDGGNSLTVDGTVAATQSGAWNITNVSGTVSLPTGAATETAQTAGNGSLTTIEAATKLEDAPHVSGDRGMCILGVRQDADTSPVSASGDYHAPIFDAAGNLKVNIKAGAGSGGTALQDNATFTPGTTNFTPIGGEVDDTATTATAEGQAGAARITPQRALHVNLRDASGAELAVGGGTQYDEDTPHVSGDKLTLAGVVRRDVAASGVSADGDRATLNVDAIGRLWVRQGGLATDQDGFTVGATQVQSVGGAVFTGTPGAQLDGFICAPALTGRRGWHTNLRNASGVEIGTATTPLASTVHAQAVGGATPSKLVSTASTNATSVKASAGTLYLLTASNVNAAAHYLKLYNKATAPTVGTDVPVFTFIIPGNIAGAGTNIPLPACGINFSLGIAFALTVEATDAGTTGVAANEVVVNIGFK